MEGFVTVQQKAGTDEIREDLVVYGSSVIRDKFPHYVDGLKAIQRRIIWFSRDYDSTKGLNKVIGDIGDFHTGGDSSIYEAIIRLSQPFKVGHPLMRVDGKNGEYYDPSAAAAPRYLKAMLSEFSRDVFFKGVEDKTLPMIPTKDFSAMEPRYLIPRLPTALLLGNTTVGFGFKSLTPMIDFDSVCDIVMKYAEYKASGHLNSPDPRDYAKLLLPSFPIRNLILNKEEIIASYMQGNFTVPIKLEGVCELAGNNLTLRSIPYGNDFGKTTAEFRERLKSDKDVKWLWNYITTASQYSSDEAEFAMPLKQGRNPFMVLDSVRSMLKFNDTLTPIYNFMYDGKAIQLSPLEILTRWYDERFLSVVGSLKYKQAKLIERERTIRALLIVSEDSTKVKNIIENSETENDAVDNLFNAFADRKLSWRQAEIISKLQLRALAKANKQQLLSDLEQNKIDQQNTVDSFGKVHQTIFNDAQNLKKKYGAKQYPTTYASDFKGYVQYGDMGISHFTNEQEMLELLNSRGWGSTKKYIHIYDNKCPNKFVVKGNRVVPMVPSKQICCSKVICYPNVRQEYSLVVNNKGSVSVVEGAVTKDVEGFEICPISKNFYAIHKNGSVTLNNVDEFTIRKSISTGRISDIIYGISSSIKDVLVFHMNTNEPNVVRIDRILCDPNKLGELVFVPGGKTYILGVYPINAAKEIYLNIPDDCRKNVVVDFLIVREVANVFSDNSLHQRIDINKTSALSKKLKRNNVVRSLFTLDFRKE